MNRELQQWVKKIRQPGGTRAITRDQDDSDDEDENLAVTPIHKMMGHISKLQREMKRTAAPVTPLLATPAIKQSTSTGKKPKLSFKTGSKGKKWVPKTIKKKFPKVKSSPSLPSSEFDTAEEEDPSGGFRFSTAADEYPLTPYEGFPPSTGAHAFPSSTAADDDFGDDEETFMTGQELPPPSPLQKSLDSLKESMEKEKAFSAKLKSVKQKAQESALKKLAPAPGWKPFGTPTKRRMEGKDW